MLTDFLKFFRRATCSILKKEQNLRGVHSFSPHFELFDFSRDFDATKSSSIPARAMVDFVAKVLLEIGHREKRAHDISSVLFMKLERMSMFHKLRWELKDNWLALEAF